jgi:hypothetical protein
MRNSTSVLVFGLLLSACSDGDGDSPDSTGGTAGSSGNSGGTGGGTGGATGGSAGSTGGSSGGTGGASTAVRGAVSLHVLAPQGCSLPDHFQDFPELPSGHPVTETAKVQAVEHGSMTPSGEPVSVLCRWISLQAPLSFDAVIRIGFAGNERFTNVGATGSIVVPGETRSGGIGLGAPDLPAQYGGGACIYTLLELDTTTRSVWGQVTCDTFETLDTPDATDVCALGPSYFFFENCTPP